MGWLVSATNVNITDTGALAKRDGYALTTAGNFSSMYSTEDFSRLYLVEDSNIKTFDGTVIATLASTAAMHWAEVNDQVYFNNGTDSGVIQPDNEVLPWRDAEVSYGAGFKNDEGEDIDVLFETLPLGATVIQFWKGRMYAAQYFAGENQTVIWFSEPMGFHLFNLDSGFFMVPGEVTMLAPTDSALIVGTDAEIYAYNVESLTVLADYGVIPGQHWSADGNRILFWSARGLCAALPLTNLTEKNVSVAPGVRAGGCVIRDGGQKRFLVCLQRGKEAFNAYS